MKSSYFWIGAVSAFLLSAVLVSCLTTLLIHWLKQALQWWQQRGQALAPSDPPQEPEPPPLEAKGWQSGPVPPGGLLGVANVCTPVFLNKDGAWLYFDTGNVVTTGISGWEWGDMSEVLDMVQAEVLEARATVLRERYTSALGPEYEPPAN